jgi:preprotein translocase subunit YajC
MPIFALQGAGGLMGGLPILIIMFGMMYLLLILPQQRKQKKWQQMLNDLKTGDRVTTTGGVRGVIVALRDDAIHLRVPPDNIRMEVVKASVQSVTRPDEVKN